MLPFFDKPQVGSLPKEEFAHRLRELACESIFIGTSSWKYPGWLGSVYSDDRYRGRSRFSERKFNETCLSEYAEVFPAVGGDFSFYRFYDAGFWRRLFAQVPSDFQFGLKVPQEITTKVWPKLRRHGAHAGQTNTSFLDAELLQREFLEVLAPHQHQVGALMLEFGNFSSRIYPNGVREFAGELDRFLGELPSGFRYAVEIRNEEFVDPHHFDVLKRHNVAQMFNSWTKMPSLREQFAMDEAYTADFTADFHLGHVNTYLQEAFEFDGGYLELSREAERLRVPIRELLVGYLMQDPSPTTDDIRNLIEGWVDEIS